MPFFFFYFFFSSPDCIAGYKLNYGVAVQTLTPELPSVDGRGRNALSSCQMGLHCRARVQGGCKKQKRVTASRFLGSSGTGTLCARAFRDAVSFNSQKLTHPL